MTKLYLVYSLDPRGWIDVYPKWVCQEFTKAYDEFLEQGSPKCLILGERFFGATIHFKTQDSSENQPRTRSSDENSDNDINHHYQSSTNGGYRSVESCLFTGQTDLTTQMYHTDYSANQGGGWRFNPSESQTEVQPVGVDLPAEWFSEESQHSKTPIWQWGRLTGEQLQKKKSEGEYDYSVTLKRLPDSEWVAYDLEASKLIEAAWQNGETEIVVEVGLRQYKIVFEANRVFAKQVDVNDTNRVRVVKRNPNLTEAEIKESLEKWEQLNQEVHQGDACPLCYEKFTGFTPYVTLKCGHIFHCACLQPMLVNNLKNHYHSELTHHCPMCREGFTSEEYTELTGDEIKITEFNEYYGSRF